MKKRYIIPIVLIAGFFLGPKPSFEDFDGQLKQVNIPLQELTDQIAAKEAQVINLKPDNHSRIIWADSIRKTEYSIVYLHGFSASPKEGDPIHTEFAQRYGANLYVPRLEGHGIEDDNAFENLTPKAYIESAKDAIAIGKLLGEKVILMSCSTGSTLALYLAGENPNDFHGIIMYSPNIDLHDGKSEMLTMPWGGHLANMMVGENITVPKFKDTELGKFWTATYSTKGVISLKYLIEHSMTKKVLSKVKQPYLLAYYYKDETHFDDVVSIESMKWFHEISATPSNQKRLVALPNVGAHVMTCDMESKDLESVRKESYAFAEEVLGLIARK